MPEEIVCPTCGVDDHLRGEGRGGIVHVTCEACGLEWDRDPSPRCPTCSGRDLRAVPQAVWERARGNQLSTVALRTVHLCPRCDAETLRRHLDSGSPVPPAENPAGGPG